MIKQISVTTDCDITISHLIGFNFGKLHSLMMVMVIETWSNAVTIMHT
jgi:hypothetical protein